MSRIIENKGVVPWDPKGADVSTSTARSGDQIFLHPVTVTEGVSYFDGSILGFLGVRLGAALVAMLTLGLALPWTMVWWQSWVTRHTVIQGRRLRFIGTGGSLVWRWVKMWFLLVVTLGVYSLWAWRYLQRWKVERTVFA